MADGSAIGVREPLVLAVDIGSSASRVCVYDAGGRSIEATHQRVPHQITTGSDGSAVVDADLILGNVTTAIDRALAGVGGGRIAAVAADTFAASLIGIDAEGTPLTPCLTYADARSAAQVVWLREELDEAAVQQRTGCRFSTSYLTAQLRWLRETQPHVFAQVARWLSLGEYIYARLLGTYAVSYSTAAWSGLLDRRRGDWDVELLSVCGARPEQFSPLHDTGEPLAGHDTPAAARWPALAGARWFPAVADGYASNVGSGATDAESIALAAGTSGALRVLVDGVPSDVPPGLWCYRVDRRRSLLGGALNDVGRLALWLRARLQLPEGAALNAALLAPPEEGTPAVLPFLTGERSPGWSSGARAVFADVTDATSALSLWRGALEGVALRYALIAEQLLRVAPSASRILASGGVTETTPGWLQIVADALGHPVTRVAQPQATMRGAALIALEILAPNVPRESPRMAETYEPVAAHAAYYRAALARQEALYASLVADTPRRES